ncbi:MAG TPA: serine/threonine-protein kinase [Burkholderiales bacterium]|nr:serine/threonine-protein kinase [Burkholderiales bacterium]
MTVIAEGQAKSLLERIGKYEIKKLLGKGTLGTVYLGVDPFANSKVAIKLIDPSVFQDPTQGKVLRKQFLNEASLAGKLVHPHIVSILDAEIGADRNYVVMEYVPGGSLAKFTRAQSLLPVRDVIEIGFKCCGALDYASRQGIVHRDVKPANIMVVSRTEVKLSDFGAAYLQKALSTQILNIGSPAYMSPEQISAKALTQHSDMFSLAVVLYELLTGFQPFIARSMSSLFQMILHQEPLPPSALRPSLGSDLDRVLLLALKKNPQDRYPAWADFALELAKVGQLSVYDQEIPDSEKFPALRAMEVLKQLSDPEIWELVNAGRWSRLPAQTEILRENEPGQSLYFLTQGQVKVTKHGRLLGTLIGGECFGEMSYIRGGVLPRQATVESLTEAVVVELKSADLERLSDSCQLRFGRALMRTLVDRLALANVRMSQV